MTNPNRDAAIDAALDMLEEGEVLTLDVVADLQAMGIDVDALEASVNN